MVFRHPISRRLQRDGVSAELRRRASWNGGLGSIVTEETAEPQKTSKRIANTRDGIATIAAMGNAYLEVAKLTLVALVDALFSHDERDS